MATKGQAPPRHAFGRLTSCSCWSEALSMLKDAVPLRQVAAFIQGSGDLTDMKTKTLERQLGRYKKRTLAPKLLSTYMEELLKGAPLDFDDVEELSKVVLIQKQRVARGLEFEKMTKTPIMASLTKELVILFDLIERRTRLLQDMGARPKAPQDHRVLIGDATLTSLLEAMPPDARANVRAAIAASRPQAIEGEVREVPEEPVGAGA